MEHSAATRRQLILSAMRLMAEKGLGAVSLRAVNVEAGAKNASAAHYHFGSKRGLIEAIVQTLADDVAKVRAPMVTKLRDRGKTERLSPREVVEVTHGTFLGLVFHPEYGLPGIKFLSRLIVDTGPEARAIANKFTGPLAADTFELLSQALPDLPPSLLKLRILFSLTNLINGMSDVLALENSPFGNLLSRESFETSNYFIEYIAAGISAPPTVMTSDFVTLSRDIVQAFSEASGANAKS